MILDNAVKIRSIDKSQVYSSVEKLGQQCLHAYEDVYTNQGFKRLSGVKNIIMSGMGGSGLAARVIKPLYQNKLKVPVELVNSYDLPAYTSSDSFVILSSYSGNTEETMSTARQALNSKAKIFSICAGGDLYEWSKKNHIPVYKINPIHNPSKQPRMAIGYSIFGQLSMLAKAGFISLSETTVRKVTAYLELQAKKFNLTVPLMKNPAKQMAEKLYEKIPVLVGSEHLSGALYVTKNQINENAKTFSLIFDIPELNHHLMEGLKFPSLNKKVLSFIFYQSALYHLRNQKRHHLTIDVVRQNDIETLSYSLKSSDALTQVFETIQFGAYWQFYLSMLNGIDPAPIPWVDYFKAKL